MSNVSDVLNKAADIIEKHGWTQGHYYNDGCYCTVGAIARARLSDDVADNELYEHIASHWLARELWAVQSVVAGPPVFASEAVVTHWNDRPKRTQEEVIATLRAAAKAVQ